MPIQITGDQTSNTLTIPVALLAASKGSIALNGTGSSISIGKGCTIRGALIIAVGSGCQVTIGDGCRIGHLTIYIEAASHVTIGDQVAFNGTNRLLVHETAGITIGSRCLIASGVEMTSSDMHSILDAQTGQRINPPAPIDIAEHVWIAKSASILKGTSIAANSVIGAFSVVTGRIPANCVAAGIPARVLRTGTNWDAKLLPI